MEPYTHFKFNGGRAGYGAGGICGQLPLADTLVSP